MIILAISAVVAWLAYIQEMNINQISTLLQKLSQLAPAYGLPAVGILLLTNFVLSFLFISVLFEIFQTKD